MRLPLYDKFTMMTDSQRRWSIYLIACLLFILSQFYRSCVAVISPNLTDELHLDAKDLGMISAAFFYAFAAMQIPISIYLDSIGPRLLMSVLSIVAAAGAVLFAWGESAATLMLGRVCLGMGMACNLMGPLKLITSWFPRKQFATLSTLFLSVGTAGNIAAATPLVWLTESLGWRTTFIFFALGNLLVVILFYAIARDHPEASPDRRPAGAAPIRFSVAIRGILQLFIRRDYWLISVGTFFRYGIFASVQALWAGPFLMIAMGLSQVMTGNLLLAISIGLIIGSPVCGWLSDTILQSRKVVVIGGLAAMAVTLAAIAVVPADTAPIVLFSLFFGFGIAGGAGQIMYAHIKECVPHENAGAAMTGINFFTMTGVAVFLHGLGWVIKAVYPDGALPAEALRMAFMVFGGCLAAAGMLYGLTRDGGVEP
jgi:sugar phosphate permease